MDSSSSVLLKKVYDLVFNLATTIPDDMRNNAADRDPMLDREEFWLSLLAQIDPKIMACEDNYLSDIYDVMVPAELKSDEHKELLSAFVKANFRCCVENEFW